MGMYPIFGLFNLVVLFVVLVYVFRRRLGAFFSKRSQVVEDRRSNAAESLEQAEKDHEKYYDQIRDVNQHMQRIMEDAAIEGEKEGLEMLVQAEQIADRIISQSMNRADYEVKRKNVEFYKNVAEKSVQSAEEQLRKKLTIDKQIEIGRKYLKKLREEGSVLRG